MNKIKSALSFLCVICIMAMILNGCKEVGPSVPWGNNGTFTDTTYIESPVQQPQTKNALIEEITGVSCVNCPSAHIILDNLITTYNNHVIGVSYQPGTAYLQSLESNPPGWTQVLTSTDAQTIIHSFTNPDQAQ